MDDLLTLSQLLKVKGGLITTNLGDEELKIFVRLGDNEMAFQGPPTKLTFRLVEEVFEEASGILVCPTDTSHLGITAHYISQRFPRNNFQESCVAYIASLPSRVTLRGEGVRGTLKEYFSGNELDEIVVTKTERKRAEAIFAADELRGQWVGDVFMVTSPVTVADKLKVIFAEYANLEQRRVVESAPVARKSSAAERRDVPEDANLASALQAWLNKKKRVMSAVEREKFNWADGEPLSKTMAAKMVDCFDKGAHPVADAYAYFVEKVIESGYYDKVGPSSMEEFFYSQLGRLSGAVTVEKGGQIVRKQ